MPRALSTPQRHFSEEIAPGIVHQKFYPGGVAGPNGETRNPFPGGQTWSDIVMLGGPDSDFIMALPDIRMPPNQYWPLHWHDCWTVVLLVEGTCCVGDWWMKPGDVFVTIPSLEYGPLVVGPEGCRLFEIFGNLMTSRGGYAPEYRDHPTLRDGDHAFFERSALNRRNEGRQTLPLDGVEGIWKDRLEPGRVWNLGDDNDPQRCLMKDTRLAAGEALAPAASADWNAIVVMDGSIEVAGRSLGRDELLLIQPGAQVPAITGGANGAQLLDLARTARGALPHLLG